MIPKADRHTHLSYSNKTDITDAVWAGELIHVLRQHREVHYFMLHKENIVNGIVMQGACSPKHS